MLGVVRETHDSWLRHVMRWYSHNFHTPLHQVQDLPLEDILTAYYEHTFEQMEEDDRAEYLERLCETEEEQKERAEREAKADQAGEDLFETLNQQVEEDIRRGKPMPKTGRRSKPKLPGKLTAFDSPSKTAEPAAPRPPRPGPVTEDEEPVLDMKFDERGNLSAEELLQGDPLGTPRKKV